MRKLFVFIMSILLFSFNSLGEVKAASLPELQNKLQQTESERQQLKTEWNKDQTNQQLSQKYSKLIVKENAYKKAIDHITRDWEILTSENSKILSVKDIPENYVPIYQAAANRYGIDWTVIAAIHYIETSFSTHVTMTSSAGAIGHMQFIQSTFEAYGVDGNGDGKKDPWNLQDAIFSAANYLAANNFSVNQRKAIWHYNHAEWYVNEVLATAAYIQKNN